MGMRNKEDEMATELYVPKSYTGGHLIWVDGSGWVKTGQKDLSSIHFLNALGETDCGFDEDGVSATLVAEDVTCGVCQREMSERANQERNRRARMEADKFPSLLDL